MIPSLGNTSMPQVAAPAMADAAAAPAKTPKFQDVWKDIQVKMGEKPKEQRQIKKSLDQDDFMKIMLTQMKNQDPSQPFDADKLAQEITQITSIDQLKNVNKALDVLSNQNKPLEKMAMTGLIGKSVKVDMNRFNHTKGKTESVPFYLKKDAAEVNIALVSDKGEIVLEKNIGSSPSGANKFVWDGLKKNTIAADSGNYMINVTAKDAEGRPISTEMINVAQIVGVNYEGKEPVLLVKTSAGDGQVTFDNIVSIVDPGAQIEQKAQQTDANGNNMFSFTKGEGSKNLEVAQAATTPIMPAMAAPVPAAAPAPAVPVERGFPNGLSDYQSAPAAPAQGGEN